MRSRAWTLLAFHYDNHGRVIAVTDRAGLSTHIERDPTGLARAIVGPYGPAHRVVLRCYGRS